MIRDNVQLLTALMAPPETHDAAMSRVSELGSNSLMGLAGAVFRDADQLRKALGECGYHAKPKVIMDSGRIKTIELLVEGYAGMQGEGWEYKMIVTEVAGQWARVDNCKLTKFGPGADPERVAELKELMRDEA
jgi:hypothetical protein